MNRTSSTSQLLPATEHNVNEGLYLQVPNDTLLTCKPSDLLPRLEDQEIDFFDLVKAGDVNQVASFLQKVGHFDINCQNYQGFTGLIIAIKNEDPDMVAFLLQCKGIVLGAAPLYAVKTGNCRIVEVVLDKYESQEDHGIETHGEFDTSDFDPHLTPLVLAGQCQHYEVISLLLGRGHTIDHPHKPNCFCKEKCKGRKKGESLTESRTRLNAYKALASPAYICQTSADPILTAFQLSHELACCAESEREFRIQYQDLSQQCANLAVSLLDQCRTTSEVHMVLDQVEGHLRQATRPMRFSRVDLAIDYEQKAFVAHSNCQQVLRAAWLAEWQDWKKLTFPQKLGRLLPRIFLLPLIALTYLILPRWKVAKTWRSPINKFFSFTASYVIFLTILYIQNDWDRENHVRGPPKTGLEWPVVIYVIGFMWYKIKKFWVHGYRKFFSQKWNIYDVTLVLAFLVSFCCWGWAYYDVLYNDNQYLERRFWHQNDPRLIGEGLYAVATILAFGRLMYVFQIGYALGPLQVSISRMFKDISYFLVIFMVVMFSFATGLHKLYHYYKGQVRTLHGIETRQSDVFLTFQATVKTLFWAIFALVPFNSADVIIQEYTLTQGNVTRTVVNKHKFTEAVGFMLFGLYHVAAIVVLLNLLIAMMSTSYNKVFENVDMEWKFARTKVWMSYFEHGNTLPPPFNLIPSPKSFWILSRWLCGCIRGDPAAKCTIWRCWYYEDSTEERANDGQYQVLMSQLVQRHLRQEEEKRLEQPVTMADVDLLRLELKEIQQMNRNLMASRR